MDYQQLKEQVAAAPASQAKDYRQLLSLTCIAGGVWPQFAEHLKQAKDCQEFFQSIYDDDACRFENAWAYWAKTHKELWVDRFEPEWMMRGVPLEGKGFFLQSGESELLVPLVGRGHVANVYLFAENGFNEKAAEFYGAINGSFTCLGMPLEGAFDIYRAHRSLLFERWDIDELRRRANGKGQIRTGCDCSTPW
ncbi:MAG: hypothetical protein RR547_01295 [Raoultibacter sp.]